MVRMVGSIATNGFGLGEVAEPKLNRITKLKNKNEC